MLRTATLTAALLLGVSSLAFAQSSSTSPNTSQPSATTGSPSSSTSGATAPSRSSTGSSATSTGSGASSGAATSPSTGASPSASSTAGSGASRMTEADVKRQLEQQGYSQVQLKEDASSSQKGGWTGTAMKGGKQVNVQVDSSGKVTEK